jgi:hypothetical protein
MVQIEILEQIAVIEKSVFDAEILSRLPLYKI